jgi:hypothetical protein
MKIIIEGYEIYGTPEEVEKLLEIKANKKSERKPVMISTVKEKVSFRPARVRQSTPAYDQSAGSPGPNGHPKYWKDGQCQGVTNSVRKGSRCRKGAEPGSDFCFMHAPGNPHMPTSGVYHPDCL